MRSFYLLCEEPRGLTIQGLSDGLSLAQCTYHKAWYETRNGGAVHPPLWSFIQELGRLVGFGV